MEPIGITVRGSGEWVVVHRCTGCEEVNLNRSAGDDNPLALLRIAVLPLALVASSASARTRSSA